MNWGWIVPAVLLGGCAGTPLERMTNAAQELVTATNEGQVALCEAKASQASALGQLLQPQDVAQPSMELETLQKLLQRFLGAQ